MFKLRLITATILAVLFAFTLMLLSPEVFASLIVLVVLLAGWEWTDLAGINAKLGKLAYLIILLLSMVIASYFIGIHGEFNQQLSYQICLVIVVLWAIIFLWLQGYPSSAILWSPQLIMCLLGLILLTSTWLALASIVSLENGQWMLALAITIVVLADLGGYMAGKLFGRHKLAPTISPGKTWEGFMGAIILEILLILLLKIIVPNADWFKLVFLVISVSLCSVIGDLFESMLKRHRGVKDSSSLLPGHGGVLDRLDGVMAALPIFFVILIKASPF